MSDSTTDADPLEVLLMLQARVWHLSVQRGHIVHPGAWQFFTCDSSLQHQWHVFCGKRCSQCGKQATIGRRVIGLNIHYRSILPPRRCISLAEQIIREGSPSPTLARLQQKALDSLLRHETEGKDP